ncbi:hypothetical protein, partial [Ferrimicrobium acidiphilum]
YLVLMLVVLGVLLAVMGAAWLSSVLWPAHPPTSNWLVFLITLIKWHSTAVFKTRKVLSHAEAWHVIAATVTALLIGIEATGAYMGWRLWRAKTKASQSRQTAGRVSTPRF